MSKVDYHPILIPVTFRLDDALPVTREDLVRSLREYADQIALGHEDVSTIIGRRPVNSHVEDRWVLRSTYKPHVILRGLREQKAQWVEVHLENLDISDSFTGAEAAKILHSGPDRLWVRPENISGAVVRLSLWVKSGLMETYFDSDIRDFLASGDEDLVVAAFTPDENWNAEMIEYLRDDNDPGYHAAMLYTSDGEIKAELSDRDAALTFLKDCRPDLHDRIIDIQPEV